MRSDKIRVLIIEPSRIVSEGLTHLLESSSSIEVTCTIQGLSSAYPARKSYDMVIVNPLALGNMGLSEFKTFISPEEAVPVAALVYTPCDENSLRLFDCWFGLMDSTDSIIKKIGDAAASFKEDQDQDRAELSDREKDVLIAVAKGLTNKEIASSLNLSVNTVMTHRRNISRKLNINSISGLTVYAILKNLIDISQLPVSE